jgi:prepilin-type processing-associated H-X9-DG protein
VVGAFLICPCHLPLTIAFATTVLAGTTAGVLLRAHPLAAGVVITAAWADGHVAGDSSPPVAAAESRGCTPCS